MIDHPLVAVVWFASCVVTGFIDYGVVVRRYGRSAFGRFAANSIFAVGYLLGIFGVGVLWPSAAAGSGSAGYATDPMWWTWPRAFAATFLFAPMVGGLLTWMRRLESYRFVVPELTPWLDEADAQELATCEASGDRDSCQEMASYLQWESDRRARPLPPELAAFVRRHLPANPDSGPTSNER